MDCLNPDARARLDALNDDQRAALAALGLERLYDPKQEQSLFEEEDGECG